MISIVIVIINLSMEEILNQLTDKEKMYSYTEKNISFSFKLSVVSNFVISLFFVILLLFQA